MPAASPPAGGGGPRLRCPRISAVQDAASNTPGIAQGSIFIVKGTNLSASGYTPFAPPRPHAVQRSEGHLHSGSRAAPVPTPILVYLFNQNGVNQIACILPSTVAVGNYNVTVTNGTASAPFAARSWPTRSPSSRRIRAAPASPRCRTTSPPRVVDLNRLTTGSVSGITISPAKPGQPVIAYGTGPRSLRWPATTTASPVFDFRSSLTIPAVVGGVTIPVDYAGRAGYAGEDQINFTLPANVPTGCAVPSADFGQRQAQRGDVDFDRAGRQHERLRDSRATPRRSCRASIRAARSPPAVSRSRSSESPYRRWRREIQLDFRRFRQTHRLPAVIRGAGQCVGHPVGKLPDNSIDHHRQRRAQPAAV